jgi:hypothetical protein
MHLLIPGVGPQTLPMKFPSTWKLEKGQWCWYIDRKRIANGPFGQFHPGPGTSDDSRPIVTPGMLQAAVRPERNQITVDITGKTATTINFANTLPGPVTLQLPAEPGLKIEIANASIPAGKSIPVSFQADLKGERPATVTFTVAPTGQKIPIQIIYSVDNH